MALSPRQKQFCRYLVNIGKPKEAAIAAGYSEKSAYNQSSRLMRNDEVLSEISRLRSKLSEKVDVSAEKVVQKVAEIAFTTAYVKDSDRLKALELLGKKFGLWDGSHQGSNKPDFGAALGSVLESVRKLRQ